MDFGEVFGVDSGVDFGVVVVDFGVVVVDVVVVVNSDGKLRGSNEQPGLKEVSFIGY